MIYLLEDDASIRKLVVYTLHSAGMEAVGFSAPSEFFEAVKQKLPRLVLLDIMLPEEDGLSVLSKLRASKETEKLPVMILTAKSSEFDKVMGLDLGADDYMTKPFGMMELLSRVKALLRRAERVSAEEEYRLGALYLSVPRHVVTVDDKPVSLSLKEFNLLQLLLRHRGMVVSREDILSEVWGYADAGESRTVDVHIRTLRQKLGEAGALVETVKGVGYKISG